MGLQSPTRSVLIFGGAGFVGVNWAHHLLINSDASIHLFDNLSRAHVEHNLRWLQRSPAANGRLRITIGDIRDYHAVERAVYSATEIYHLAAQVAVTKSLEDPRADFEINAGGTFNIVEAARRSGKFPFLLFTSSSKVYGHVRAAQTNRDSVDRNGEAANGVRESQPLDFYSPFGCSKGIADQYVHDYGRIFGIPTVVFRMSCIAGSRQFGNEDQGWVAHFVYSALQSKSISIYGNGRQVRDVLAVEDLLRAFSAAYDSRDRTAGQIYNIGGGPDNSISLLELVELIERNLNLKVEYRFRPARPGDQNAYITNFDKFTKHTKWLPERSVEQTVYDIYHWYKSNENLFLPAGFPAPENPRLDPAIQEVASPTVPQ